MPLRSRLPGELLIYILLALLPLRVACKAQLVEKRLHRHVLDGSTGLEHRMPTFFGIANRAERHGQANALLAVSPPDTQQATLEHIAVEVLAPFTKPTYSSPHTAIK